MTFGEKVKKARILKNLSQTELAAITGISERSLYTYEQLNTIPRKNNLKKLAEALNVSIFYLIDEEEVNVKKNIEKEEFIDQVKEKFGYKGAKEAQDVLARAGALFAGGDLDDDAKEIFMQSLMQVYISSKKESSVKFSRKKKTKPPIDESVL
ncbi:helix-turn-helix domain-containing protein [Lachnotalea glycerini]|uniref:Helix-turn-helix domain-containing protein n=1 Tax=Lachnotalea glycerini TaxID=1763509 RepID=A0A371JBJ6_9FIRM|nr:helix-turn-helix domain-containing protein [Lachnotalea glycerini]RDY30130.1 helix-turn-helix domain-containing protein [Lachnotalea glycerini]